MILSKFNHAQLLIISNGLRVISKGQFAGKHVAFYGDPPKEPKAREVEFSKKEVLREEVELYRQPDHGWLKAC